jgi:hypothetical protein
MESRAPIPQPEVVARSTDYTDDKRGLGGNQIMLWDSNNQCLAYNANGVR